MKFLQLIVVSALFPMAGTVAGYNGIIRRKSAGAVAFCIAIFMAGIAYCYYPITDTDLTRYFAYIDQIKSMSFGLALRQSIHGEENTLFVFSFLCWLIGKTGDYHLLPMLSCFVIYYVGTYITCSVGYEMNCSGKQIATYLAFSIVVLQFYWVVNNIRNVTAFCLVAFAVYREVCQKKKDIHTLLLYIIPIFIHHSCIVIIFCRLLMLVSLKYKLILSLVIVFANEIVGRFYVLAFGIGTSNIILQILRKTIIKSYQYYNDTSSNWATVVSNSSSHQALKICYLLISTMLCVAAYLESKEANKEIKRLQTYKMSEFSFCIGLVTLACLPMRTNVYWRFSSLHLLVSGIIWFIYKKHMRKSLFFEFMIIMIVLASAVCIVFDLRNLRNMDYSKMLFGVWVTSPIFILFKDAVTSVLS